MHRHAVFNSLHRGGHLATSVESTSPERLAWVGVYTLDLEKPWIRRFLHNSGLEIFPASGRAYRIRFLEVQRRLIEADASTGETEIENGNSVIVFSDDGLVKELGKLEVAIESLELPYKSNYPI
jgi:hypothetical protein